jgi:hypothetical protein
MSDRRSRAPRGFVDGWRRHGLDVDPETPTHPGEYHYFPEHLAV